MNSNNYFTFEKCYEKPPANIISDASFSINLRNNFYESRVSSVEECQTKSFRNNSNFFLINDISTSLNTTFTNCYIPKIDNTNSVSVITRSRQIFDDLFNTGNSSNPSYITQNGTLDICNTLMYNINRSRANLNQQCFKYTIDNQVYAPRKYYAYYKKPILNNTNIISSIMPPEYYKNKLTISGETSLKFYEELLEISYNNVRGGSGSFVRAFTAYICGDPTDTALNNSLDIEIGKLQVVYNRLAYDLSKIKYDLSAINYFNSFDDETLRAVNLDIASKKHELNGLLGSGGANNGRLDDTTLLTQFKIVENSILLLLIICAIFFLTKSKKTILAT